MSISTLSSKLNLMGFQVQHDKNLCAFEKHAVENQ